MSAPIACVEIHHLGDTWCVFVTRLDDGVPRCTKIGAYPTLWEAAQVTSLLEPKEDSRG